MTRTFNYLPQAFITKGKKRLKQFEQTVYLNGGDNYEIELFNPTQKSVLTKIQLDGEYISNGGIVVRPGERIYLERFLDTNNRFVFNTYNVDDETPLVKEAIKQNGKVRIEFYNQSNPKWYSGVSYTTANSFLNTSGTNTGGITFGGTGNPNVTYTSGNPVFDAYQNSTNTFETGRTEMGEASSQSFVNTNEMFEYFAMYTVDWQILPNSQKVYTQKDIKRYCGDCGSKIKKTSYKFCPHCGSELD